MNKTNITILVALLLLGGILYLSYNPETKQENQINPTENSNPENSITPEDEIIPEPQTTSKEYTVEMLDFEFSPEDLEIKIGDTITWINKGKGKHYVMSSSGKRILDSKTINPGESWSYTFNETGYLKYFSPIYTRMSGTIIVKE